MTSLGGQVSIPVAVEVGGVLGPGADGVRAAAVEVVDQERERLAQGAHGKGRREAAGPIAQVSIAVSEL